jgi:hypothetical protein
VDDSFSYEDTTMRKLASLALVAALGIGAATFSKPADAGVVVGVGVGLPVPVAAPAVAAYPPVAVGYYPGFNRYPRYYGPGYARWGYGWHRGWYRGHGRWR